MPGNKSFAAILILVEAFCSAGLSFCQEKAATPETRPVIVADTIRMTRIAGRGFYPPWFPKTGFAVFSPDGKHFAIVIVQGNPKKRIPTSTLCWSFALQTCSTMGCQEHLSLCRLRQIVMELLTLNGRKTMTLFSFSGSSADELTQLYSVRCTSGRVEKLTNNATSLVSYALSEPGDTIVFAAEGQKRSIINEDVLQEGFHVTTEDVSDLIRGQISSYEPKLFSQIKGGYSFKPC